MTQSSEAGSSLVEVIIAVVIMSIVMVAILGGMGTSTAASGTHRRQAEVVALLTSSAERLKSEKEVPYVTCATPTTASYLDAVKASQHPAGAIVTGSAISITSVEYWQGNNTFSSTCQDATAQLRIQRITLSITSESVSETVTILKRGTP